MGIENAVVQNSVVCPSSTESNDGIHDFWECHVEITNNEFSTWSKSNNFYYVNGLLIVAI